MFVNYFDKKCCLIHLQELCEDKCMHKEFRINKIENLSCACIDEKIKILNLHCFLLIDCYEVFFFIPSLYK